MTSLASVSTSNAAPTHGNAQVQRSPSVRRHHDSDGDDDAPKAERRDGPGRRNPLVAAMMSALDSLVPASSATPPSATPAASTDPSATPASTTTTTTTTTPATTTSTPATTTPSTDPAGTLREAAYAFAHALYSALRGDDGGSEGAGRHHHHGHRGGGYGDLAERLTALANKLEAGSGSSTPTTPATPTDSVSPTPPVVETPAPEPAPATESAGSGNISITINVNINIGTTPPTTATPDAPSSSNPLVDAFKKLLTALGADGGSTASPTERLTAFLRQMAESLSGDTSTTPSTPTSGSLLNVSA